MINNIYIYILVLICRWGVCQVNLVNNFSFESYSSCPGSYGSIGLATGWINPEINATPDYYNSCSSPPTYAGVVNTPKNCSGFQIPKTGNSYAGIFICDATSDTVNIGLEYIQTHLNSSLVANTCYYFEMYYSLSNSSGLAINNLSAYMSTSQFTTSPNYYYNTLIPQITLDTNTFITDTLNWMKLSGFFVANGGEQYLTIGNFKDGSHIKKTKINATNNSLCTFPDSNFCYVYIDDVSLYACTDVGIQNLENDYTVSLYPNPANTEVYISAKGYEQLSLSIYNLMGELIIQKNISDKQAINVRELSAGTYIYRLTNGSDVLKTGKLMISK